MPTVTFPSPVFSGTISSDSFKDFLYAVPNANPENTLEVINGRLDADNLASGATIEREHCQPGSAVKLKMVSGSVNLDYPFGIWGGTDNTINSNKAHVIPGAAQRFYFPYENGDILLRWNILWQASIQDNTHDWLLVLKVNNTIIGSTGRRLSQSVDSNGIHDGTPSLRHYSGHWWGHDRTEGWHDAGMYLVPLQDNADPNMVRIRARNFVVGQFKRP